MCLYTLSTEELEMRTTRTAIKCGQSKRGSLAESLVNIAVGYGVAFLTQMLIFPWFGIHATTVQNLKIGAIFTVVSLIRSYLLRRAFNLFQIKH
jgi:hypothetical protein